MAKPKVLFLCKLNRARSQMAEAFLERAAGDRFEVYSAGLGVDTIHPLTVQVMAERGIDLRGRTAKGVTEYLGKVNFAYIITVCDAAEPDCPTFPGIGSTRLNWPFPDPLDVQGTDEERLAAFREVRDAVAARIDGWLEELGTQAEIQHRHFEERRTYLMAAWGYKGRRWSRLYPGAHAGQRRRRRRHW